jgi:hypothetical protein
VAIRRILPGAAAVVLGLGLFATGSAADAGTSSRGRPAAIISIGDSYISGEAGRWLGNSPDSTGDRAGTDRAFVNTPSGPTYDPTKVYGSSGACHRSDVAPITQIRVRTLTTINIACSGATTENVLRHSAGGFGQNGEDPQDDQLLSLAQQYDVKAIALTIGGNDLGFAQIVFDCVIAGITHSTPCNQKWGPRLPNDLARVQANVARAIEDIRATMADAGYRSSSFKLVLTSYPIGLPDPADMRYPEAGPQRLVTGGCPFLDADVQWGHSDITPRLAQTLRAAATQTHTQFLDVSDAFRGHELCSDSAVQPTSSSPPDERTAEWLRFIDIGLQGSISESFHPNAFGQRALGRCLAFAFLLPIDLSCSGVPGRSTQFVHVRPLR